MVEIDTESNWEEVTKPGSMAMMGSPPCGKETGVTALRTRWVGGGSLTQRPERDS